MNDMVHFNDFVTEYQSIKDEIDDAVSRVLNSGRFIFGMQLEQFENELAEFLNVRYCVGVGSGTEALTLSLIAHGITNADEVITTNFTAYPTINGIINSGAKPVVVDVKLNDGLIDPEFIISKINSKTKAIVPVHLYGKSCDMKILTEIAQEYNLKIIEDCAQACGSKFMGVNVGTLGDCGAFSFYPTKNLGAYGDAGSVVTNNKKIFNKVKLLRNYGQSKRYIHELNGMNSRLDELQASILRVKLKYLNNWNKKRDKIANYYDSMLKMVAPLDMGKSGGKIYHLYVIRSPHRDALLKYLKKVGIETFIHYPLTVNKQISFNFQKDEELSNSESLSNEVLSLPVHPWLKQWEICKVVSSVNNFFK